MLGLASLGFLFGFKKSNNEDDMKSKLEKLLDIEEIKKLKYRYFRGIDMADMELLESLFTDNASLDYRGGSYRWQVKGKKDILEQIANAFHSDALACHQGHHPEIEITGLNTAKGLWYLSDIFTDTKTQTTTRKFPPPLRSIGHMTLSSSHLLQPLHTLSLLIIHQSSPLSIYSATKSGSRCLWLAPVDRKS